MYRFKFEYLSSGMLWTLHIFLFVSLANDVNKANFLQIWPTHFPLQITEQVFLTVEYVGCTINRSESSEKPMSNQKLEE